MPAQRAATPERIAQLQAADGFSITVFAKDVANARMMAQAENGIIYVTRPAQADVIALMDEDGDGMADCPPITATAELTDVHGIVITGNQVYLATPTTIHVGEALGDGTFGELETIVDDLPDGGQHGRRTMGFGPMGGSMSALAAPAMNVPTPTRNGQRSCKCNPTAPCARFLQKAYAIPWALLGIPKQTRCGAWLTLAAWLGCSCCKTALCSSRRRPTA